MWVGPENVHFFQACRCCWSRPYLELQYFKASGFRAKRLPPPSLPCFQPCPLVPGAGGGLIHSCEENDKGVIWISKLVVMKLAKKPRPEGPEAIVPVVSGARAYPLLYHVHMCICMCAHVHAWACSHAGGAVDRKAEIWCWQTSQALDPWFFCFPLFFYFTWGLLHGKHSYNFSDLSVWDVNS